MSGFKGLVVPSCELPNSDEGGGCPAGVKDPAEEGGGPAGVVEGFEALNTLFLPWLEFRSGVEGGLEEYAGAW